jgi:hypothetical protein
MLVLFVSTMHNKTATKNWPTNIKTIESSDVSACFTDGSAQPPQGARHIIELTIKSDGVCSVRKNGHKAFYDTD